ncbi:MAG: hypothetical protein ABSE77_23865, partial [Acidimicrobiales bacterium]
GQMDPVFASALRDALVAHVEATRRQRRRWRWRVGLGVLAGSTVVAGGAALAASLLSQPGAPLDTQLGSVVTATRTGTATINLGPAPAGATNLSLTLTCLSAGTFYFPDGSMSCSPADLRQPPAYRQASEVVPLAPGQRSVIIKTSPESSWALQAAYINRVITPWATNARGETYGVWNQDGTPDLVAVVIDQGKLQGYVKASDLNCASGLDAVHSPAEALAWDKASEDRDISLPVYKSDGTTVIGTFVMDDATHPGARTVPLSSLHLGCQPPASSGQPAPSSQTPSTVSPAPVTTVQGPAATSAG